MQTFTNKKSILIIDDEAIIRRVYSRILIAEGYEVDTAENGLIAKDMVNSKEYDLFLCDIRTPEMNGMEFYNFLKSTYPQFINRVIFTTGDVLSNDIKTFLNQINNPVLVKPFTNEEIRAVVRNATYSGYKT